MSEQVTVGDWVDALRSGEYKQGQKVLRNESNEYCCLGVLCDLLGPEEWSGEAEFGVYDWGTSRDITPPTINDQIDVLIYGPDDVTMQNDNGRSFLQIADFIEKTYARDRVIEWREDV